MLTNAQAKVDEAAPKAYEDEQGSSECSDKVSIMYN
jgi:hypothetical protein